MNNKERTMHPPSRLDVFERDDSIKFSSRNAADIPHGAACSVTDARAMIIRCLRESNFTLRRLKRSDQGYISDTDRLAVHPGGLCIRISESIHPYKGWTNSLELDYFQYHVKSRSPNPNGPMHEFDRLRHAPYLIRQRARLLNQRFERLLSNKINEHRRDTEYAKPRLAQARIEQQIRHCSHFDPVLGHAPIHGHHRQDMHGKAIQHGGTVWFRDRKGRWARGTAYFNLNSQWYVQLSATEYTSYSSRDLSTIEPDDLRDKDNTDLRERRLQAVYANAKDKGDIQTMQVMQRLLFCQPKYRLYSTKHGGGWWRPQGAGYTSDRAQAGLFDEAEAQRLCQSSHGELTMHPCGENAPLQQRAS
jgi:hypothetical protein